MTKELITAFAEEILYVAFDRMTGNQIGRLPVIERGGSMKLIGIISREDVWRVYNIEISSRLEEVKLSGSVEENINRTPEPNSKDVCAFNCRVNRVKKRLFLSVKALPF